MSDGDEGYALAHEARSQLAAAVARAEKAEAALAVEQNDRRLAFAQCQEAKRRATAAEAACAVMREALEDVAHALRNSDHYQITHANVTETLATNAGAALLEERDRLRAALESATHACDLAHNPTGHNRDHVNETLLRALQKAREALE
jgi:hypothetical protein